MWEFVKEGEQVYALQDRIYFLLKDKYKFFLDTFINSILQC